MQLLSLTKRAPLMLLIVMIMMTFLAIILSGCGGGGGGGAPDPTATIYKMNSDEGYGIITVYPDRSATLKILDDYEKKIELKGTLSVNRVLQVRGRDSKGNGLYLWATFNETHYGLYTTELRYKFDDDTSTNHLYKGSFYFYKT